MDKEGKSIEIMPDNNGLFFKNDSDLLSNLSVGGFHECKRSNNE